MVLGTPASTTDRSKLTAALALASCGLLVSQGPVPGTCSCAGSLFGDLPAGERLQSQQGEWGKGPGSTVGMTLAHQVLGLLFRHHWSWSHLHSDPLGRRECGQGTCRRLSTVWFLWPAGRSCQSSLQGVGLFFSALHFCISCRGLGELWLQPKCPSLLLSLLQLSCDCRRRRWAAGVAAQALCWSQGGALGGAWAGEGTGPGTNSAFRALAS